jgi:hypothetical protein
MPYVLAKNTNTATEGQWQFDTIGEALVYAKENLLTEAEFFEFLIIGEFTRPEYSLTYYQGTLPTP